MFLTTIWLHNANLREHNPEKGASVWGYGLWGHLWPCQEAGQVIWYAHLFQNFPQFIVIHTVKGFGLVNKAEVAVFLELSYFWMIQQILAI